MNKISESIKDALGSLTRELLERGFEVTFKIRGSLTLMPGSYCINLTVKELNTNKAEAEVILAPEFLDKAPTYRQWEIITKELERQGIILP